MGLLAIVYCVGLITNFSIYGIPNKYSLTLFKGWSICCATGGQLRAIRGVNLKRDEGVSLSVFSSKIQLSDKIENSAYQKIGVTGREQISDLSMYNVQYLERHNQIFL